MPAPTSCNRFRLRPWQFAPREIVLIWCKNYVCTLAFPLRGRCRRSRRMRCFQRRFKIVPIRFLRLPGIEGTEETGSVSHYGAAPHLVGNGLACSACHGLGQHCWQLVGASIARPFSTVPSALSGRDIAINVLVRSQSACGKGLDNARGIVYINCAVLNHTVRSSTWQTARKPYSTHMQ